MFAGSLCVLLAIASTNTVALTISQVRTDRFVFDPAKRESAEIKFHIDEAASVEARFFDAREFLIASVRAKLAAGDASLRWDGRDIAGKTVPPEAYHYVLLATDDGGASVTYDVSDAAAGQQIDAQNVAWDADTGRIRYRIAEMARVNIRVGLRDNGPLLRTIVDWVARPPGDNEEAWDGWDAAHVLDLSHHPKLSVFVDAYALGRNTILVGPPPDRIALIQDLPWGRQSRARQDTPQHKMMHYHSQQPIESSGDVAVEVSVPQNAAHGPGDVPVVKRPRAGAARCESRRQAARPGAQVRAGVLHRRRVRLRERSRLPAVQLGLGYAQRQRGHSLHLGEYPRIRRKLRHDYAEGTRAALIGLDREIP